MAPFTTTITNLNTTSQLLIEKSILLFWIFWAFFLFVFVAIVVALIFYRSNYIKIFFQKLHNLSKKNWNQNSDKAAIIKLSNEVNSDFSVLPISVFFSNMPKSTFYKDEFIKNNNNNSINNLESDFKSQKFENINSKYFSLDDE